MPESIALAQLKGLLADGVQLVDVLPPEEYVAEHLPGAVNVPLKQLDAETTARRTLCTMAATCSSNPAASDLSVG
jgi:rhodanese-related sulfurtransferase